MARKIIEKKADPVELPKTDKEFVLLNIPDAECVEADIGMFHICVYDGKMNPVHSGFAKNESDAWKKAAHQLK